MNDEKEYCWKTGKVCYTQRDASGVIHFFKIHKNKKTNKNIPVRTYLCQFCKCYHLTHYKHRYRNQHEENKKRERKWVEGVK